MEQLYDPEIFMSEYLSDKNENTKSKRYKLCNFHNSIIYNSQDDTCTPMFIIALFTIAKIWKQT